MNRSSRPDEEVRRSAPRAYRRASAATPDDIEALTEGTGLAGAGGGMVEFDDAVITALAQLVQDAHMAESKRPPLTVLEGLEETA